MTDLRVVKCATCRSQSHYIRFAGSNLQLCNFVRWKQCSIIASTVDIRAHWVHLGNYKLHHPAKQQTSSLQLLTAQQPLRDSPKNCIWGCRVPIFQAPEKHCGNQREPEADRREPCREGFTRFYTLAFRYPQKFRKRISGVIYVQH